MILVTIQIDARPAKQKELSQTLCLLAGRVRKEAGCVSSQCYREVENENALCVLEQWRPRRIWTPTCDRTTFV